MRKTIVTSAITGAIHTPTMSDALPVTADAIAEQAIAAAEALVDGLAELAGRKGATPAQVALAWLLAKARQAGEATSPPQETGPTGDPGGPDEVRPAPALPLPPGPLPQTETAPGMRGSGCDHSAPGTGV